MDHGQAPGTEAACTLALSLGFDTCLAISPGLLLPDEAVRAACRKNLCGNYDRHHRCPPRVGSLAGTPLNLGPVLQHCEMPR